MYKIKFLILILIIMVTATHSAVIHIPADYTAIQHGIILANTYDTILVSPGTYNENLIISKRIVLISSDGPDVTTINGNNTHWTPTILIDSGATKGTEVNGFTITGGDKSGILINGASPTIRKNIITGNVNSYNYAGAGIWVGNSDGSLIEHNIFHNNIGNNSYSGGVDYRTNCDSDILAYNIFYANGGDHVIGVQRSSDNIVIYNNTITGSKTGIRTYGGSLRVFNNLFFNFPNLGIRILGGSADIDYNCFFENGDDFIRHYGELSEGSNNVYADGQLVNLYQNNFNLLPFSPCIGAGYQDTNYINPYDKLEDIGAIPYLLLSPMPYQLSLGLESKYHVLSHSPTFYWSYYDTASFQTAYQIEVDTSFAWSTTPIWSSGEINADDTETVYSGVPLEDSLTYYFRVQVYNEFDWSDWVVSKFRMNTNPTTPIPSDPTALEYVTTTNVNLIVVSSYDSEYDSLVYDFELSEDIFFSIIADSKYGIPQQNSMTASGQFSGILPATRYYWRCRSFDGFEYSDWSETESFLTRNPTTYYVPSQHPTIQAALNIAIDNDSVIVASGTYSGIGNRDLDFGGNNIVLKSEAGAEQTIIDCGGTELDNHIGFIFQNDEDSTSVIDGFTITNAHSLYDGAILITNGSCVSILNSIITHNQAKGIALHWSNTPVLIDNCVVSHNTKEGYSGSGSVTMTNSIFHSNGMSGATLFYGVANITNCTFAFNGQHGLNLEGDPPRAKISDQEQQYGSLIYNCLSAYNGSSGITRMFLFTDSIYCCNSFGNGDENWSYYLAEWGFGNDSLNPMFCDTSNLDFRLSSSSPLLPSNNACNSLIGKYGIGCDGCCIGIRGDIDYDGLNQIDIADIVYFVQYSFGTPSGPAPPCFEEADLTSDSQLDISDLVFLVAYMFQKGDAPPSCP